MQAAQIAVSLLLIFLILIQVKGMGLGRTWGGSMSSFSRRGVEKLVFRLTFVTAFLFVALCVFAIL